MGKKRTSYFAIDRKLLQDSLWLSEPFTKGQAWVDLIGMAAYEEKTYTVRGQTVTIQRGQVGISEVKLAERWKWGRGKVRRYLRTLNDTANITTHSTALGTVITIENYTFYQGGRTADDTANDTADGTANDTLTRNKEIKKYNISLYALDAHEEAALRTEFSEAYEGLMQDVLGYYEEHAEKRFPGWTKAMRQFSRNQRRWQGSSKSSRTYVSTLDKIMAEEYDEEEERA